MNYLIIGCGKLGVALGNALMLGDTFNSVFFYEPMYAKDFFNGEFKEMEMVAKATGNRAVFVDESFNFLNFFDSVIITAGVPRLDSSIDKKSLLKVNLSVVREFVELVPNCARCFVASNPPIEICAELESEGFSNLIPLRSCVDDLRRDCWGESWNEVNELMLNTKGFTSYGPAVAMASEILLIDKEGL